MGWGGYTLGTLCFHNMDIHTILDSKSHNIEGVALTALHLISQQIDALQFLTDLFLGNNDPDTLHFIFLSLSFFLPSSSPSQVNKASVLHHEQ